MGADYLKEAARRAKKGWKDGGDDLRNRKLFDRLPPAPERTLLLKAHPQCQVSAGDYLILQDRNGEVAAYNGLALVGSTGNVPPAIQNAINFLGMASGFVTDVDRSNGTIEIAVASSENVEKVE